MIGFNHVLGISKHKVTVRLQMYQPAGTKKRR